MRKIELALFLAVIASIARADCDSDPDTCVQQANSSAGHDAAAIEQNGTPDSVGGYTERSTALALSQKATDAEQAGHPEQAAQYRAAAGNAAAAASYNLSASDPQQAKNLADQSLQWSPQSQYSWVAYQGRGSALIQLGQPQAAQQDFSQVIALKPNIASAYSGRAMARLALGDTQGAAADADKARSINPNDKLADGVLQQIKIGASGPLAVKKVLPPSFASTLKGGEAAEPAGVGGVTASMLRRGGPELTDDQKLSDARVDDSASAFKLGDYQKSLELAEQALKKDPRNLTAYLARAAALNALGRFGDALNDLNLVLKAEPGNADALAQRAFTLDGLGKKDEALADMRRAASLDPGYKSALAAMMAKQAKDIGTKPEVLGGDAPSLPVGRLLTGVGSGGLLILAGAFAAGMLLYFVARRGDSEGELSEAASARLASEGPTPVPVPDRRLDAADRKGMVLRDRYKIEDVLGRGGMGVVYKGRDLTLLRPVAVKEMIPGIETTPQERARFIKEAQILAELEHPNIISIYDLHEYGGDIFLVFEYVEGQSLDKVLKGQKRLPLDKAAELMRQVCLGVGFAHSKKIEHRDLKPSNIMVAADGAVKIMDFGIAKKASETLSRFSRTDPTGTPAYMAPEQHRGETFRETDVYALTATFYEAISGVTPFRHPTMVAEKEGMDFVRPSALGLPDWLDAVIEKGLAAQPKDRYRDAMALYEAIETGLARSSGGVRRPT